MKFDNSHTQALKDFVIHLLRNCPGNSADEDILADYVIALLKYDKPRPELRRLCTSQLDDFLKEETQPFVTKLFQALSTEDYLGANKQARPTIDQPEEHTRPRPLNGSPNEDEDLNRRRHEKSPEANLHSANRRSPSPRPKNFPAPHAPTDFEPQDDNVALDEKSVKRRRPDEFVSPQSEEPSRASKMQRPLPAQNAPGPRAGPPSHQQHSPHQNYGPSASQHRRPDMTTSRGDHMGPGMVRPMHPIQGRTMHVQWPHGGPNVNIPGQQRIPPTPRGMPSVMGGGHPQDQPRGGRKPRCRDYEERGFCIRGETCPFDHGDRIIDDGSLPRPMHYNPAAFPNMAGIPGNMRPPFFVPMGGPPFESMMGNMNRVPMPVGPDGPMQPGAIPSARGTVGVPPVANAPTPAQPNFGGPRGGVRGGTGFRGNGRGRGGRGGSNGARANFHSQKGFTLLVENIPENHCAIDKVNDFFKKFGTVTNIQVDPQNSKALVQFSNNAEAYKAYSSPEPIFDNRFVRVFWHEKEKEPSTGEISQATASSSASTSDVTGPAATVAAHAAHLAEMNAAREEKARLRKEQMEKMMEVQKQKEALIQKQIEEQKLLMEAMSKNLNIPEKEKAELMRRLESVANSVLPIATTTTTASSGLSKKPPSAKLAEEKERERLDRELDLLSKMGDKGPQDSSPEVTEALQAKLDQLKAEAASLGVNEYSYRGRGGGYRARGRGAWAPRGRGIGGPAAYKPYSLDLRPTKILMKSVPASVQPKLKEHFERYGDVESVSLDGGTGNAIVQYKTRHEAEKAFYNGGKFDEIPEKLEMSWYQDGVPTNNPPSSSSTAPIRPNSAVVPSSAHAHMEDVRMRDAGAESEDDDEDGERNWKRGI